MITSLAGEDCNDALTLQVDDRLRFECVTLLLAAVVLSLFFFFLGRLTGVSITSTMTALSLNWLDERGRRFGTENDLLAVSTLSTRRMILLAVGSLTP